MHTASIITSETQVYSSKTTWYYIPEGCHLHTRCHENLKISNDHVLRVGDQPGGGEPQQHGWLQHTQIVALSVGLFILPQGQNNTVEEGTNFTAESSIRQGGLCKVKNSSCHISSLVTRQASAAKYPAKHKRLPCLLKVGYMNQNISHDLIVGV
jgi:hypothetical protein